MHHFSFVPNKDDKGKSRRDRFSHMPCELTDHTLHLFYKGECI